MQVADNVIDTLEGPTGLLSVGGAVEVTDNTLHLLRGLAQLDVITGSLVLAGDDSLQIVEALFHLAEIGGDLLIHRLPELTEVRFLDGLSRIDGVLPIADNRVLASIMLPTCGGPVAFRSIVNRRTACCRVWNSMSWPESTGTCPYPAHGCSTWTDWGG